MKSTFKIAVLLFLIPLVSFANTKTKPRQEKSKTIKKEYSVSSDATVKLDNKYGNLNITTWDKNRVEITVVITVKGNNLSTVEKRLEDVEVEFKANSDMVSAKTIIPKSSRGWFVWNSSKNTKYQINYTVKMPVSNSVKLNNDYGTVQLNELNGAADINVDYGKLVVGDLNNANNNINIDYCKNSNINFMRSGSINTDYSRLTVDKTDKVKINSDYSTVTIESANTVTFNADYGNIIVNDVKDITGNTDYVSVRLGTVSKSLNLDADYGSIKIKELAKGFSTGEITGSYAGITIGVNAKSNFNFIADLSYARLRYDKNNVDMRKSIIKSSKRYFEGTFGKGSTNSKLHIKSSYGNVNFKQ